jgi:hypothetical protein
MRSRLEDRTRDVTLSQPQSNRKATNLPFVIPPAPACRGSVVEGSAVTLSQPQCKRKATREPRFPHLLQRTCEIWGTHCSFALRAAKKGCLLRRQPFTARALLDYDSARSRSGDVGIAAISRGDRKGISPGWSTATAATTTATEPRTHSQKHQHHQRRRPSPPADTRYEK